MAPEVIQGEPYDQSADIWSLGITAYEMATGKPPYYNLHAMRALFLIPTNDPPRLDETNGGWSDNFRSFVSACLQKDPSQRPSATALRSHPFVQAETEDIGPLRDLAARSIERQKHLQKSQLSNEPKTKSGPSSPARGSLSRVAKATAANRPVWDFGTIRSTNAANEKDIPAATMTTANEPAATSISAGDYGRAMNTAEVEDASTRSTLPGMKGQRVLEHNAAKTGPAARASSHEVETEQHLRVPTALTEATNEFDVRHTNTSAPRLDPMGDGTWGAAERTNTVADTLEAVREAYKTATGARIDRSAADEGQLIMHSLQQTFLFMERVSTGSTIRFAEALLHLTSNPLGTLNPPQDAAQSMANPVTLHKRVSSVGANHDPLAASGQRAINPGSKVPADSSRNSGTHSDSMYHMDADASGIADFLEQRWRSKFGTQSAYGY